MVLLNYPHKLRSGPANRNWFHSRLSTAAVDLLFPYLQDEGWVRLLEGPYLSLSMRAGGMQAPWGPGPAPAGPWGGPARAGGD